MGESCPKCGTTRDAARTHCAACGLAHDKMAAFAKARDDVPEALTQAWQRAIEQWDDLARHDEVLRLSSNADAYAWAAARYRERVDASAGDTIARDQLDRVRRAAEATLLANAATRQTKTPEPYRNTILILGVMIIAILAGLVYAIARGDGGKPTSDHVPVPPGTTK